MSLDEYASLVGQEIALSKWFEMTQDRINAFAAATEDWSFIHIDHERAAPFFGGTVAHGFLTLSMIGAMAIDALPKVAGRRMAVNYGFDKVRLITPVPSGSLIRGRFVLTEIVDHRPGEIITRIRVTVEIGGFEKPAIVADWLYHSRLGATSSK
ncbi:MAG: MaoC family dehydratase [Sphingomonadaceae bacterium]